MASFSSFFQYHISSGSSWSPESLKNLCQISPTVQNHLKRLDGKSCRLSLIFRVPGRLSCRPNSNILTIKSNYPQNTDLPRYYSKKEKKPFPVPIVELRRAARERLKNRKGQGRIPVLPPRNGLLVRSLIPVAYEVLNARVSLINNLSKLMKAVPVKVCSFAPTLLRSNTSVFQRLWDPVVPALQHNGSIQPTSCKSSQQYCSEIHVGLVGHPFKSCRGPRCEARKGMHDWTTARIDDVLIPVDAFHLFDRLGKRITHEERFSVPRVPAVVELCVQAGVELPNLPTKRRRKPVIRTGRREFIDANEDDLPDYTPEIIPVPVEIPEMEIVPPADSEETKAVAKATLEAWETMRGGAGKLMKKYHVRVCGYCPEVHVGSSGHKAQNCGAYKHQQRNGQHGWQAAVLNDLIPPSYVWHVPDGSGLSLKRELKSFYGQAPAVVEICIQGGADVPEQYKPTMRLDVGIPADLREAEMVV